MREPPEHAGPGHELLVAIRDLHLHAGEPSLREIARATGKEISYDTVHRILKGKGLPRWRPLELVVEALDGDVEEFRALWIAARRDGNDGEGQ